MQGKEGKNNPLYRLLIEPEFRLFRYSILILLIGLVGVNHVFLVYAGSTAHINLFLVTGVCMFVYLLFIYINIHILIPGLLLAGKYLYYIFALIAITAAMTVSTIFFQYLTHLYYEIPFGRYSFFFSGSIPVLEFASDFLVTGLSLTGVSIPVLLKNWLLHTEKEETLKKEELYSRLDGLKERITPCFLFNALHKAGELAEMKSGKSSQILLRLSQLLRYQLYDCSRDIVLLRSEIKFLSNYLNLETCCNENLNYKITYPQLEKNYFIPPLLLIPFVESSLNTLRKQRGGTTIALKFEITDGWLIFICTDNRDDITGNRFSREVPKRLKTLNSEDYVLAVSGHSKNSILTFQYRL